MKIILILITLLIGSGIYAQTDSTEKVMLNKKQLSREISKAEYSFLSRKWNETMERNKYPELPFNSEGKVQYSFIMEFKDMSKQKLCNRILEWLTITHGIVPAYLYKNPDDGKIICSNSTFIQGTTLGTYTFVFTIKDGKVLIDFMNVGFKVSSGGFYSGDNWIPENTSFTPIDQVYPISTKDISTWTYYLKILETIDEHFNTDINGLNDYIINYDLRYLFE